MPRLFWVNEVKTLKFKIIKHPDKVIVERHLCLSVEIPVEEPPEWLRERGFDAYMRSWHGFGYARKSGKWYAVDNYKKEIIDEVGDPASNLNYVLSHVVHPDEWGEWVCSIPIECVDCDKEDR